jgi:hypothetical protein
MESRDRHVTNELEAIIEEPVVLIRIHRLYHDFMGPLELYEATRGVWKMGQIRFAALFAFAVFKGVVKEVYRIDSWQPAGTDVYETRSDEEVMIEDRVEFIGRVAPQSVRRRYVGKSVRPYLIRGNSNPITYVNC